MMLPLGKIREAPASTGGVWYNSGMDETIYSSSPIGKRLEAIKREEQCCLLFQGKKIPLVARISIGRGADNDLVIDNKLVSRRHALVQKIKSDFFIQDLGSANGTFLNGKRLEAEKYYKIRHKDSIKVVNTELHLIT